MENKDRLVIIERSPKGEVKFQEEWWPGQPSPTSHVLGLNGFQVQVVAYGSARDWIHATFGNVRKSDLKDRSIWVGEDAAFIANNICEEVGGSLTPRTAFEKEAKRLGRDVERSQDGGYKHSTTEFGWSMFNLAWREFRKAFARQRSGIADTDRGQFIIGRENENGFPVFSEKPVVHYHRLKAIEEVERLSVTAPTEKFALFRRIRS